MTDPLFQPADGNWDNGPILIEALKEGRCLEDKFQRVSGERTPAVCAGCIDHIAETLRWSWSRRGGEEWNATKLNER